MMSASKQKPSAASQRPIAKPKTMSSKLLTMKFMQRSAATSTSKNDTLAAREALIQENAKRDAALQARERNSSVASVGDAETRWELSYVKKIDAGQGASARVVDWGYGEIMNNREEGEKGDESEDEGEKEEATGSGRMIFGQFKRKGEPPKPAEDQDSDSDSDSDDASGTPGSSKKEKSGVSLRGLTSISNPGPQQAIICRGCGDSGHSQAKCPKAKCYACEGVGHMSRDCPRARRGKRREPMFNGGSRDDMKRRRSGN